MVGRRLNTRVSRPNECNEDTEGLVNSLAYTVASSLMFNLRAARRRSLYCLIYLRNRLRHPALLSFFFFSFFCCAGLKVQGQQRCM